MPEIAQSFEVDQPVERVWTFFQDMGRVASCIPGAELGEAVDDRTYAGALTVKLGAITARFEGTARITDIDADARHGTLEGNGVDRRGAGTASGTLSYRLVPEEEWTRVEVTATYRIQGRLAQFGRTGLIEQVAARMTRTFAECLHDAMRGAGPPGPAPGPPASA